MSTALKKLVIPPQMFQRGFWLYVWVVTLRGGRVVHYVGRTGDSSSRFAQSPVARISGHLGPNARANTLKKHLEIDLSQCEAVEFIAHGPLESEAKTWGGHVPRRDRTHALERDLCNAMKKAGYEVMNDVTCRLPSEPQAWELVRAAFAERFERLAPSAP